MTANLQARPTVKQAARIMSVSERMIYGALKLQRSGRADLCTAVQEGRMTLHAALRAVEGRPPETRLGRLKAAFARCTPAERAEFLASTEHQTRRSYRDHA